jgi:hypothetical protein
MATCSKPDLPRLYWQLNSGLGSLMARLAPIRVVHYVAFMMPRWQHA